MNINLYYFLTIPLLILIFNYFFEKNNILKSLTGDKHQLFIENKNIPLTGGIYLFFFSLFFFTTVKSFYFFLTIFLIGFMSDSKLLNSAKLRFLLQVIIIFFIIINFDLHLNDIKILFFNFFLKYELISYIFFTFCLLIVINGTNFIDGLNGLVIGYYLIILSLIVDLNFLSYSQFGNELIIKYIILLFYLLIFNLLNKLYLGDSGSYLIGLSVGALLISIYNKHDYISPFFIVLLLWYPCFENLFSIIRKFRFNSSPLIADNKHLHHLLFYFIKKKFNNSRLFANNFSSLLINSINFIFLFIGSKFIYNSIVQISLITILLLIYILIYFLLFKFRYKKINH